MARDEHPGASREQPVHELLGLNSAHSRWHLRAQRSLSRFVGRQAECELIEQCWRRACSGRGQVVLIPADPGVGKSRLTHEVLNARAAEGHRAVESGALELERDVAFSAVKPMLRSLLGIGEGESVVMQTRKLAETLAALALDPAPSTPLAFALDLPIEDPAWREAASTDRVRRVADAIRILVAAVSRGEPLLILVEDLHWMDRESRGVLDRLVESIDRQRVLLLLTCRPEFRHDWADRSSVHVLRLHPLEFADADLLVRSLVGNDPSVAILRRLLVERTDGTPLLIEETVRALQQAGRIVGETGAFRAPEPLVDIETASSVTPVIAGRIERLPAAERRLLQIAAEIGRNAPRPLLRALSGLGEQALERALAALERQELLFELLTFPEREYAFKHALIHDVAYASLLTDDRRELHAAALRALDGSLSDSRGDNVEVLADHAYRAHLWDPAARYLAQAADRAIERSAYHAATVYLERAIEALHALPPSSDRVRMAVDVRLPLRLAYMVTGDYRLGVMRLGEARELARRIDDAERQVRALLHLSYLHSTFGRIEKAIRAADEAKAIAERNRLERYVAEADLAATQGMLMRSGAREALPRLEPHFDRFTTEWRYDRFGLLVTRAVWYLGSLGFASALLGRFEAASVHMAESEAIAGETRRPVDVYAAAYHRNLVEGVRGPTAASLERMRQVAEDCLERAPYPFLPLLLASWGDAQIRAGQLVEAFGTLERARDAADAVHMVHVAGLARALLACARAATGYAGAREERPGPPRRFAPPSGRLRSDSRIVRREIPLRPVFPYGHATTGAEVTG